MQIYLGSAYVNDFDFNNRAYRVYVQADKAFRSDPKSLGQYYARTNSGSMVPLASVVRVRETTAPQVISHFNLFRSAEINGSAAPGVELGAGDRGDGAAGVDRAAAGLRLRVVGDFARGDQGGPPVGGDLRHRHPARLPHAGGAVRIAGAAVHRPAGRAARGAGRAVGAVAARTAERPLLPDRAGHADRPGGEERDPDRRVRRAAAPQGAVGHRRGHRSGARSGCGRFS